MSHHKLKKEDVIKRMNKIIGQLNGVRKMIEQDRDCPDILLQIASARSALGKLGLMITEDHMEHCISDSFQKGKGQQAIVSMSNAIKHMLK